MRLVLVTALTLLLAVMSAALQEPLGEHHHHHSRHHSKSTEAELAAGEEGQQMPDAERPLGQPEKPFGKRSKKYHLRSHSASHSLSLSHVGRHIRKLIHCRKCLVFGFSCFAAGAAAVVVAQWIMRRRRQQQQQPPRPYQAVAINTPPCEAAAFDEIPKQVIVTAA